MVKAKTSSGAATSDQRLRGLEAELARAAERHRLAKQAVKDAKADAKSAKKETKRARKALAAAQEEEELAVTVVAQKARSAASSSTNARATKAAKSADASPASPKRRIADSPERPRPVQPRKKPVVADGEATHASSSSTADSSTAEAIAGTDASQQADHATVDSAAEVKPG